MSDNTATLIAGPSEKAISAQQPLWSDPLRAAEIRSALAKRPALVTAREITDLREAIAATTAAGGLIVQGGDCAERFTDSSAPVVARKLDQVQGMADALRATGVPVVSIGRIAGQYGKPRSSDWETHPDGGLLPSYRGDLVNDPTPTLAARMPDPERLLIGYDRAVEALDQIRRSWAGRPVGERVYASHELLVLDYEEPLVRGEGRTRHSASTHFGWIGERTRALGGAHLALAAGIDNPIGVKLGPTASPADVVELSRLLNPDDIPGRLTFIVRMGADRVAERLPDLLSALRAGGPPAIWMCDPMHGNTIGNASGQKVRAMSAIRRELESFVHTVRRAGLTVGGVHLEMTPDDVTECVATDPPTQDESVLPNYQSPCDPRLNRVQASTITDLLVGLLRTG
ncbi:MAG: 3-deoxy-7-phosphoheptulonate synthase [Actinomycetota bacterium]|nr:3-deoxy-7-phosphoheptulonate synthase [Actinomycetota bacterium]